MLSAALGAVAPVSSERLRREETLRLACGLPFFIPEAREDRRPWRLSFTGKKEEYITDRESTNNSYVMLESRRRTIFEANDFNWY